MIIEQQKLANAEESRIWSHLTELKDHACARQAAPPVDQLCSESPRLQAQQECLSFNSTSDGSLYNSVTNLASLTASETEAVVSPCGKASFIVKLCEMLNDETGHGLVRWGDQGRSIVVDDPNGFSQIMLPRYFKHRNFPSFVRQLNLYGFRKMSQETSKFEYQHELFVRGQEQAMRDIKRRVPEKPEFQHVRNEIETAMERRAELEAKVREYEGLLARKSRESSAYSETLQRARDKEAALEGQLKDLLGLWSQLMECSSTLLGRRRTKGRD
eukprot:CAMPEP_0113691950 /NCGR_PEP_ID=MMETSP0038_2-20120614/18782_1 /TAXON_ID=2898 /ORGANISM="Cryptomonas paramecium" /LENGTH=271 /DNA_ID=CAMNT_0000613745 /DNA_START=340 /DNA_END=1152 /DNA_ORIENTATION=+ /assembly_acc=CAM_ASM_000170